MIVLGWPAKPLWPNFRSRSHWPKTNAVAKARAEAFYATKAARVESAAGDVPIIVQATFYPPDRRKRDYDNCAAALKPSWDGIAQALGVDDSMFRHAPPIIAEPVKGPGKVTVQIGGEQ